jgi:hypothetical protein
VVPEAVDHAVGWPHIESHEGLAPSPGVHAGQLRLVQRPWRLEDPVDYRGRVDEPAEGWVGQLAVEHVVLGEHRELGEVIRRGGDVVREPRLREPDGERRYRGGGAAERRGQGGGERVGVRVEGLPQRVGHAEPPHSQRLRRL